MSTSLYSVTCSSIAEDRVELVEFINFSGTVREPDGEPTGSPELGDRDRSGTIQSLESRPRPALQDTYR